MKLIPIIVNSRKKNNLFDYNVPIPHCNYSITLSSHNTFVMIMHFGKLLENQIVLDLVELTSIERICLNSFWKQFKVSQQKLCSFVAIARKRFCICRQRAEKILYSKAHLQMLYRFSWFPRISCSHWNLMQFSPNVIYQFDGKWKFGSQIKLKMCHLNPENCQLDSSIVAKSDQFQFETPFGGCNHGYLYCYL